MLLFSNASCASRAEYEPAPNCCKRLTKRRLFARAAVAALEQSALQGGALSARPFSKRRTKRAAVSVAVFSRFAIYANVVRPPPRLGSGIGRESLAGVTPTYEVALCDGRRGLKCASDDGSLSTRDRKSTRLNSS